MSLLFFFFKQKTAYEMRISDWSSDVCSSDLDGATNFKLATAPDGSTSRADWADLVPHRDDVFIEAFDLVDAFTAIAERSGGLERLRPLKETLESPHMDVRSVARDSHAYSENIVKAADDAYSMCLDTNSERSEEH